MGFYPAFEWPSKLSDRIVETSPSEGGGLGSNACQLIHLLILFNTATWWAHKVYLLFNNELDIVMFNIFIVESEIN